MEKTQEQKEDEIKIISIKSSHSIAESNLMVLPFVSVRNTNIKIFKREWTMGNIKRGIEVKGSPDLGVPTIKDLDVLLALFRIMVEDMDFEYEYNVTQNTAKINSPQIHFTFQSLAKEMGYSKFSGQIKKILENSLKRLNETTIYSMANGAIRDAKKGEYITEFNGEESFRILKELKIYSYQKKKSNGEKIGNAEEIREKTSVKIDDFFFKNVCNNYFKIYDYTQYLKLRTGFAKKLFLLLNQWSHGYEKFLTYLVMYDTLGIDIETKRDVYYNNKQIKKAFKELVDIKFIDDFKEKKDKSGINIIFNSILTSHAKMLDKYKTDAEVVTRLHELGLTYDDITKYYRLDNQDYVRGLLRCYDFKMKNNTIKKDDNGISFLMKGLKEENYDLEKFM